MHTHLHARVWQSEYENIEDLIAAQELHTFIRESQRFQHVFKGSSIVYAGFMHKLRGVGLRAWQRRCVL